MSEGLVPINAKPDWSKVNYNNPWHTGKPTEEGVNLILHIMSNEYDVEGYYQSGYYLHNNWFKWNGCGIALDCGEYVDKWMYEKDFLVAW